MHANCKRLIKKYAVPHFTRDSRVLEVGPNFDNLMVLPHKIWDTTDIVYNPRLTFQCRENYIPVSTESYDIVYATNVMEHVRMPWEWIVELARVCVRGGLVILVVPATWPYHPDPIDCWRVYCDGMEALLRHANLIPVMAVTEGERHWFRSPVLDTIGIGRKP